MYTDFFKTFTDQTEKTLEPYVKFNKLMAKNVEVLTELQLNAMRTYSEMGLTQMKAASEIKKNGNLYTVVVKPAPKKNVKKLVKDRFGSFIKVL